MCLTEADWNFSPAFKPFQIQAQIDLGRMISSVDFWILLDLSLPSDVSNEKSEASFSFFPFSSFAPLSFSFFSTPFFFFLLSLSFYLLLPFSIVHLNLPFPSLFSSFFSSFLHFPFFILFPPSFLLSIPIPKNHYWAYPETSTD